MLHWNMKDNQPIKTYLITSAGVSAICHDQAVAWNWMQLMIDRGGVPMLTQWEMNSLKGGN